MEYTIIQMYMNGKMIKEIDMEYIIVLVGMKDNGNMI